mmetsp:Transcript_19599/g.57773  ORF Transcript_19599/g.57773 Transcript_19599/m.57773 type:complete len:259 (-) Transcript_19599:944-1720(-)
MEWRQHVTNHSDTHAFTGHSGSHESVCAAAAVRAAADAGSDRRAGHAPGDIATTAVAITPSARTPPARHGHHHRGLDRRLPRLPRAHAVLLLLPRGCRARAARPQVVARLSERDRGVGLVDRVHGAHIARRRGDAGGIQPLHHRRHVALDLGVARAGAGFRPGRNGRIVRAQPVARRERHADGSGQRTCRGSACAAAAAAARRGGLLLGRAIHLRHLVARLAAWHREPPTPRQPRRTRAAERRGTGPRRRRRRDGFAG